MNKAVFLDRDGTINVEKNYLYKICDFEFLPGTIDALNLLQDAGYILIIITNQSGIGRGYYSEKDFNKLNDWMLDYLKDNGIEISKVYFCPHHPDANILEYRKECNCRKPKLGLYLQAIKDYNLNLNSCYAIGDKLRDCAICNASECKGFLIGTNEKMETIQAVKKGKYSNLSYTETLLEAAKSIVAKK